MILKIQRKLLTDEQKKYICERRVGCTGCPLRSYHFRCFTDARATEEDIKAYWNGYIEVELNDGIKQDA